VQIDPGEYLERNEFGDAELFRDLLGERVVFDHSERRWYLWNGRQWQPDGTGAVVGLVANVVAGPYAEAAAAALANGDHESLRLYRRRVNDLFRIHRVHNVLEIASALPELALQGGEWEVPPMLLPVTNGILDLRDGSLRNALPSDRIRTFAPTEWRGLDHPAPTWDRLLHSIFGGDEQQISFVQRLLGYAVSGDRREQVLPIFWGSGANGKSTLVDALSAVLGPDLCFMTQSESLMDMGRTDGNAARPFVAGLRHRRLVWASESREGSRLNIGLVKQLTGDETITARNLYAAPITFKQSYTLILITNHRPRFPDGDDEAIWRRVLLVPFEQRFVDHPRGPREHRRERDITAGLRGEAPGILAWLVRGCLEWQRLGLQLTRSVQDSTARYRLEEDVLGQFMEECLVTGPDLQLAAGALYKRYSAWCEESGQVPVPARSLGQAMARRYGGTVVQRVGRRTHRIYPGVGFAV
jgi:putative DNA primase/helicase